jgi:hypothetical protein
LIIGEALGQFKHPPTVDGSCSVPRFLQALIHD